MTPSPSRLRTTSIWRSRVTTCLLLTLTFSAPRLAADFRVSQRDWFKAPRAAASEDSVQEPPAQEPAAPVAAQAVRAQAAEVSLPPPWALAQRSSRLTLR